MDHDLIVIGGGAAGLGAARAARRAGADVLLVSDGPPGGDCTFGGCVPSKTLLAAARDGLGFADAMARVRATIEQVAAGESTAVLRQQGIAVVEDRARLVTHDSIAIGERRLSAPRIVVATGSRPSMPPVPGLDQVAVLTTETVFDLDSAPATLAIIGGGPTGCELAEAFADLGVQVHLLELLDRLLAHEEPEASEIVARSLERRGVVVTTGARVDSVTSQEGGAGVSLLTEQGLLTVDRVLVATGRRPNTADLGLEELGVTLDEHGHIEVDRRLSTTVRGVYAAGDVTGQPFTHAANEMGRLAAGRALRSGPRWAFRSDVIPAVVYTDPEVARVGLTEGEAAGRGARVAYLPLAELDRAVIEGRTDGFVKLIASPRPLSRRLFGGRIVGSTIVGHRAGEMIHEAVLAMRAGLFTGRLAQASHAYPSWSLGVQMAAAQFFGDVDGRSARPAVARSGRDSGRFAPR